MHLLFILRIHLKGAFVYFVTNIYVKEITMSAPIPQVDQIINRFVDTYPLTLSTVLLKILAFKEQGGLGYKLAIFNPVIDMDGWEVDHRTKKIYIDRTGLIFKYNIADKAQYLRYAIETEFLKTRASLLSRILWGSGKIILGVIETAVGLVAVVVPEPGTTVGGVVLVALGTNNIGDGLSQLLGANQSNGYNVLENLSGKLGSTLADIAGYDPKLGDIYGRGTFLVSSLALGSYSSIKVLHMPGQAFVRFGVGGQKGGFQLGRIDALYGSNRAKDGLTVLSINNNSNKSILRFVTHNGKLLVNGRIFGVSRVMVHEGNSRKIIKGLLKLLVHGAKVGR